jgi:hypothetical protein
MAQGHERVTASRERLWSAAARPPLWNAWQDRNVIALARSSKAAALEAVSNISRREKLIIPETSC